MAPDKETILAYEKEIKRLRIENLKIKLHMEVLIKTPRCKTTQRIRNIYGVSADFSNSILHLN